MDTHGYGGHGWGVVRVVRSRYEDYIKFLSMLVKHFTPVGVAFGFIPASLTVNSTPTGLIDFRKGYALATLLVCFASVGTGTATNGYKAHLELAVLILRADYSWKSYGACDEVTT